MNAVEQKQASAKPDLFGLAEDLAGAWNASDVTMRSRQQLLRSLVKDIVADVDDAAREVVLTIHWRGGQHSQVKVIKPRSGEHGCRTPEEASGRDAQHGEQVVRRTHRRDSQPHGPAHRSEQDLDWHRVSSVRMVNDIRAYRSAHKDGEWLTMSEAAAKLGVNNHRIRRLIKEGLPSAEQVVPRAPYQIRASDLLDQRVIDAVARTDRPCQVFSENQTSVFSST